MKHLSTNDCWTIACWGIPMMAWTSSKDSCDLVSSRELKQWYRFMQFMKHNRGALLISHQYTKFPNFSQLNPGFSWWNQRCFFCLPHEKALQNSKIRVKSHEGNPHMFHGIKHIFHRCCKGKPHIFPIALHPTAAWVQLQLLRLRFQ